MSEPGVPPVEPTVIVGYPDLPPTKPAAAPVGLDRLPAQVRTLRTLLIACLALLVLLVGGLGAALAGSLSRMDDLTAQVTALGAQVEAAAQQPAAAQPAPAATATAEKQLGAAAPLDSAITRPTGVDESGAVLIGDPNAADVVEVFIDYQCPFCQRWDAQVGAALIEKAVQPGSGILVKQYNLAFLGETSATLTPAGASARAANAAACVLDIDGPDVFVPFSRSVFASADPSEPPGQFTADALSELATDAGASATALACIADETHVPFVAATTAGAFGRGVNGTPTVIVNGRALTDTFADADLIALAANG